MPFRLTSFHSGFFRIVFLPAIIMLISSCNPGTEKADPPAAPKPKDDFALLNDAIVADPSNAALLYKRAGIFLSKNNTRQAFDDISRAVSIDSLNPDYHLLMAEICFKGLLIEKSIAAFQQVVRLRPSDTEARLKLAELYLYIKSYPHCIREVNEALRINKNLAKAYFIKGFAYKETGDTALAVSSYMTATEVNPSYYDAYIQLGNIHAARRKTVALQYYNNALRLQPSSTEALYNRGLLYQNLEKPEEAKADYLTILRIDRNYEDAYYNLGFVALVFDKDYKKAIEYFTDAIRVNNQYVEAFYNRGVCFELSGDMESALKDYKTALSIVPTYKLAQEKLKKFEGSLR